MAKSPKSQGKDKEEDTTLTPVRAPKAPSEKKEILDINNPLSIYMREVKRYPLLSPDEEKELAKAVFDDKDPLAAKKLIQANLRFVVKIAFEFSKYGPRILDLIQEGNMGLIKAVQHFNPYKDVRLTTYAVWWIKSYIRDYLLRNWSVVRIGTTAAQKKLFYRLKKEQQKFEAMGLTPEPKQIAMNLGVKESEVQMMQQRMAARDASMSAPIGGSDSSSDNALLEQRFSDESELAPEKLEKHQQSQLFQKALKEFYENLDEREQHIFDVRMMSEKPITLLEIGKLFKISKERARQLEERIKKKLKEFLEEHYPEISVD